MKVVHADLKSHNLLLDHELRAKVSDFGLSSPLQSGCAKSSRKSGTGVVGSISWLAPENFENSKPTFSADVYAFGIVCWEVLTREVPWADETPMAIFSKVCVR